MKPLDDFAGSINFYAPGCPDTTMYFGIRQAAIEFCERTRLWRYEDDLTSTVAEAEILVAPTGAEIHEIELVLFNGQELEPKSTSWLDENMLGWRAGILSGTPHFYTQTEPNTIRIVPREAGSVDVAVWLKPSQDATELPDWLVDQYREVIAQGALARLLLIPNQAFTNADLGVAFANMFERKLDGMTTKSLAGQQRAPVRTKASFY